MIARILKHCFVLVGLLALVACGRAGDPLTPYESAVKKAKEEKTTPPPPPNKDKDFILDRLLD